MQSLHEYLKKYSKSDILPMHMPGHKRRSDILPDWSLWEMDFTEVSGLDNLYEAEDIIKVAADRLAASFSVKKSYMLVNGSTGGLLTAISACASHGDTILVARNCHKSVYNAAYLNELKCEYVYPEEISEWDIYGGVTAEAVKVALEADKSIKAVVITSPTYEGIVSDVSAIAKVVHEYKIPLIVDEAHGAHFKFMEDCPASAVDCGADIVVQSFHKLLPALTQTAVMHVISDEFVDMDRLSKYYSMYQTSSPSYLFMASIDFAREFMEREKELEKKYFEALKETKEKLEALKNIGIMKREVVGRAGVYDLDPTKLLIACKRGVFSGSELEDMLLSDYKIQAEMSKGRSVLLMTSIVDDSEALDKVYEAFREIDKRCEAAIQSMERSDGRGEAVSTYEKLELEYRAVPQITCYEAMNSPVREVMAEEAEGFISAEYIYIYPPGVPVLVPGELITAEVVKILCYYREVYQKKEARDQRRLQGLSDKSARNILVVDKP